MGDVVHAIQHLGAIGLPWIVDVNFFFYRLAAVLRAESQLPRDVMNGFSNRAEYDSSIAPTQRIIGSPREMFPARAFVEFDANSDGGMDACADSCTISRA